MTIQKIRQHFNCKGAISQNDWDHARHEDIFDDHNDEQWRVVYIDRSSMLKGITLARVSEHSRQEVTIYLQANGRVALLSKSDFGRSLVERTKRASGTFLVARAA
ncbi:MAG: hypothetical protein NT034_03855 [Candidatus Magasanikbacteria bacterium]|nr:hypothetical protein [Candidatus Magasanikbacteria bacterium]